jgi:hypothetical protein
MLLTITQAHIDAARKAQAGSTFHRRFDCPIAFALRDHYGVSLSTADWYFWTTTKESGPMSEEGEAFMTAFDAINYANPCTLTLLTHAEAKAEAEA